MVFVFKIDFYVSVCVNVCYLTWVLGMELRPSGGAGSAALSLSAFSLPSCL